VNQEEKQRRGNKKEEDLTIRGRNRIAACAPLTIGGGEKVRKGKSPFGLGALSADAARHA
jgi:hypothetical protein